MESESQHMIVVGEKINTSRKRVAAAVENRDGEAIVKLAEAQADKGAHYIDVNAGTFVEQETDCLCWLVETVQAAVDLPLCLDSPNPKALAQAIKLHKGEPLINSISLEKERWDSLLEVVSSSPCRVVALCMAETSMPTTVEERVEVGKEIIEGLQKAGLALENIFVDPLVQPVSVDTRMGLGSLGAIRQIMEAYPGVNTICGLSNISFGLPKRRLVNRTFLALAMAHGLSAAIVDPLDEKLMSTLCTADMLLGRDDYCDAFIQAHAPVSFD